MPLPVADDADLEVALRRFAMVPRVLVALDFDGVLAPLVLDPQASRPLPESRDAVVHLAAVPGVHVALVSGRRLDDLRRLSGAPPTAVLVGGHGAQVQWPGHPVSSLMDAAAHALRDRVQAALREIADHHPGTSVEVKDSGVVLHTRGAEPEVGRAALAEVREGPARWPGVHPLEGKEVLDLSVVKVSKGEAIAAVRARLDAEGPRPVGAVFFAGDDVTDEAGFTALDPRAGDVTIKVGPGATAAAHRVADPEAFATRLSLLVRLRRWGDLGPATDQIPRLRTGAG